jgi:hypothetical protein
MIITFLKCNPNFSLQEWKQSDAVVYCWTTARTQSLALSAVAAVTARSFVLSPVFDIAVTARRFVLSPAFVVAVTARRFVLSPAFVVAVTAKRFVLSPALSCFCHSKVYTHMFMCTVCTVCVCYVCVYTHIYTHNWSYTQYQLAQNLTCSGPPRTQLLHTYRCTVQDLVLINVTLL